MLKLESSPFKDRSYYSPPYHRRRERQRDRERQRERDRERETERETERDYLGVVVVSTDPVEVQLLLHLVQQDVQELWKLGPL